MSAEPGKRRSTGVSVGGRYKGSAFMRFRMMRGVTCTQGHDQAGFTLVELAVSMLLMSLVLALFVPTLLVLLNGQTSNAALSAANVNIQPALELLQNQVNSANFLYDPGNNPSSSFHATVPSSYRFITPVHYNTTSTGFALLLLTVTGNGDKECSQWRVSPATTIHTIGAPKTLHHTNPPVLWDRVWKPAPAPPPTSLPFRKQAQSVVMVNTIRPKTPVTKTQKPFKLGGNSTPQDKEVVVTLRLSPSKTGYKSNQAVATIQYKTVDAIQGVATPHTTLCSVPPPL